MSDMTDRGRNSILVIEKGKSYIITSLVQKLEAGGSVVKISGASIDSLSRENEYNAIVVYSSPEIAEDRTFLTFLSDRIDEKQTPYYLIGDSEELETLKKILPVSQRRLDFLRPVNVEEVSMKISIDLLSNVGVRHRKKILVVDDSGTMLRKIKEWLDDRYKITLANSGARAMKALALEIPDLVLLDYEMPIVDGRQVLSMMRAESEYQDIPVMFLTGKSDKESVMAVMSLNPVGYLLKTQPSHEIIKQIDDFFASQE